MGNRLLRTATPQATIKAEGEARLVQAEARVREWQPDALVVGVPFHPGRRQPRQYGAARRNSPASCAAG